MRVILMKGIISDRNCNYEWRITCSFNDFCDKRDTKSQCNSDKICGICVFCHNDLGISAVVSKGRCKTAFYTLLQGVLLSVRKIKLMIFTPPHDAQENTADAFCKTFFPTWPSMVFKGYLLQSATHLGKKMIDLVSLNISFC